MKGDAWKAKNRLIFLLTAACIFMGLLAGRNADRYIVQVPAWRSINIMYWLDYSRHADLGNGLIFYPVEAIGGFLLLLIASIVIIVYRDAFKHSAFAIHSATLLSAVGLVLTFFAAPVLLSLRTMKPDPHLVQQAFNRFHFFGLIRAIVQFFSFLACVWGLKRMVRNPVKQFI